MLHRNCTLYAGVVEKHILNIICRVSCVLYTVHNLPYTLLIAHYRLHNIQFEHSTWQIHSALFIRAGVSLQKKMHVANFLAVLQTDTECTAVHMLHFK